MGKHTPLYNIHKELRARIVEFAGWEMPVQYTGVTEEHLAVRSAAGLFDVCHMGIFEITGPKAAAFLDHLTPNAIGLLKDNQAHYSLLLTDRGTIIDDIIIYKINATHFLMVANASNTDKDFRWIREHLSDGTTFKNLSEDYGLLALQGPKAAMIISMVTNADVKGIATFYLARGTVANVGDCILARTGYTGEDGFEIFVPRVATGKLWNRLIETGRRDGLSPAGLGARDTLRLEMKYTLYGHEITEETNALEAGLRSVIKFKKPSDFIGRSALSKIADERPKRNLIGFRLIDKGIPREGYLILADGRRIGEVTSGTFSPSLQIPIGIGYVESKFGKIGTKFYIDIRGKERLAEVVKTPFYKKGA